MMGMVEWSRWESNPRDRAATFQTGWSASSDVLHLASLDGQREGRRLARRRADENGVVARFLEAHLVVSAALFLQEHRQPAGPFETDFDAHSGTGREVQHQHLAPVRADDVRHAVVAGGALDGGRALSTCELLLRPGTFRSCRGSTSRTSKPR